jgi:hypothetical protein
MNLEDAISDEEKEQVEEAQTEARREKTKYGSLVESDE